jgi:hypothetical protein
MRGTGFHDLERDLRPAPQGILAFGDRRADCAKTGRSPTAGERLKSAFLRLNRSLQINARL